jgi:tetratricopeptide (TPR) repeat protein
VLGAGDVAGTGDWRQGDTIRYLPAADREDLEVWLLERAYRYCRMLEDRPGSPADWRRLLEILDRAAGGRSIRAFAPLRDRLAARLRSPATSQAMVPAPAWLDEHLLGVVTECEAEYGSPDGRRPDSRRAIEEALRHYDRELMIRPGSFWGHYRAAAARIGVGHPGEAAHHLRQCLDRRPRNATIQMQLAGCLFALEQYPQALEVCDRVLESAPSYAEAHRTRAYVRTASRQTAGLGDDLQRFEMLCGVLPRSFWEGAESADPVDNAGTITSAFRFLRAPDVRPALARRLGRDEVAGVDSEEVEARASLAVMLSNAEIFPLAGSEAEKILVIRPDHIPARLLRVEEAIAARRFDAARSDLGAVLGHLELEGRVRDRRVALERLFRVTNHYLKAGKADDARMVAERARDVATGLGDHIAWSHYDLARVYAVLGASDPDLIDEAAEQLFQAFVADPDFLQYYRGENPWFDPVRTRIDAALGRREDPAVVRRRLVAKSSAKSSPQVAGH